jgi:hypothetical protein
MITPPTLSDPTKEYSQTALAYNIRELRRWFTAASTYQTLLAADIFINIDRFPTEIDIDKLRHGQVYRDTATNTLKVKVLP